MASELVHRFGPTGFPYGTLAVNIAGCLAIGVFTGAAEARHALSPAMRLLLVVGVLGGFTTFSSFANETLWLARSGMSLRAAANVGVSVLLCLAAAALGFEAGNR